MTIKGKEEVDISLVQTSLTTFLASYNQNIPVAFPKASVAILRKFKAIYPVLFKHGNTWSMAQHRKRVIDWLSSYHDERTH